MLEWNLAADPNQNPRTEGGCTQCLGAITIDNNAVTRNTAYYIIAHASKFVRPGSKRVASNKVGPLYNVAFRTPVGRKVLIVFNESDELRSFNITHNSRSAVAALQGGAVATYVW